LPYTFSAQLAEVDPGDYIASYQWIVDGTALANSSGNFGSSRTVTLTRTFSVAGLHTVALHVCDSHGSCVTPNPSTQVDAQANVPPAACIIDPANPLPPPAWCTA
jgi:hypothetical protein